jgi:hypothetical protein
MPQGFVIDLNLSESSDGASDARVLDNLGISPISDDIRIFAGNLRNVDIISSNNYTTSGNDIIITEEGIVPFSNRTIVSHSESSYTVSDSNGIDRFRLRDSSNNYFVPTDDLERSNAVLFENFENLKKEKLETNIENSDEDLSLDENTQVFGIRTIEQNIQSLLSLNNSFYFKKGRVPLTFEESVFDRELVFSGAIRITNDDEDPQTSTSPGIFIVSGDTSVRGFTDLSNPWQETTISGNNYLETTANNASVQDLILNDPNISGISVQSESGDVVEDFTHRVQISVNGEQYSILLKST